MRRRAHPVVGLDPADLVLVAAHVLDADPDAVLATADVGVLSGIAERVRSMASVADAAAEVLVGIAAGRPFARCDNAVAWLAAVVLVERNGLTITDDDDDDDWVQVVRAAAAGDIDEREVARALQTALEPPVGWVRKVVAGAWTPRAVAVPSSHPCPACRADVERSALWLFPVWAVPSDHELVVACARRRGTHDRVGAPVAARRDPPATEWCPVVVGPVEGGTVPFVAFSVLGPLAFRPWPDGDGYDVVAIGELTASDRVGSWAALWARGQVLAHVSPADCRFDIGRTQLDWGRVSAALAIGEVVPA